MADALHRAGGVHRGSQRSVPAAHLAVELHPPAALPPAQPGTTRRVRRRLIVLVCGVVLIGALGLAGWVVTRPPATRHGSSRSANLGGVTAETSKISTDLATLAAAETDATAGLLSGGSVDVTTGLAAAVAQLRQDSNRLAVLVAASPPAQVAGWTKLSGDLSAWVSDWSSGLAAVQACQNGSGSLGQAECAASTLSSMLGTVGPDATALSSDARALGLDFSIGSLGASQPTS